MNFRFSFWIQNIFFSMFLCVALLFLHNFDCFCLITIWIYNVISNLDLLYSLNGTFFIEKSMHRRLAAKLFRNKNKMQGYRVDLCLKYMSRCYKNFKKNPFSRFHLNISIATVTMYSWNPPHIVHRLYGTKKIKKINRKL